MTPGVVDNTILDIGFILRLMLGRSHLIFTQAIALLMLTTSL
ncbi:hypothetical protein ACE1AT_24400 [Pelatocladus sp. BLCC-F211]